jgi:hypothetical protein
MLPAITGWQHCSNVISLPQKQFLIVEAKVLILEEVDSEA